jgi:hypothetical protein
VVSENFKSLNAHTEANQISISPGWERTGEIAKIWTHVSVECILAVSHTGARRNVSLHVVDSVLILLEFQAVLATAVEVVQVVSILKMEAS